MAILATLILGMMIYHTYDSVKLLFSRERQSDVTACRQRAPISGLRFERSLAFELRTGRQLIIRVLLLMQGEEQDAAKLFQELLRQSDSRMKSAPGPCVFWSSSVRPKWLAGSNTIQDLGPFVPQLTPPQHPPQAQCGKRAESGDVTSDSLPEDHIENHGRYADSDPSELCEGGGGQVDLVVDRHFDSLRKRVEQGEEPAQPEDEEEANSHPIEERDLARKPQAVADEQVGPEPLEEPIENGIRHDPDPPDIAGRLVDEKSEKEDGEHAGADEALKFLNKGEDPAKLWTSELWGDDRGDRDENHDTDPAGRDQREL